MVRARHRFLLAAALLLAAASASPSAGGQDEGRAVQVFAYAYNVGDSYWFEIHGQKERNPVVVLHPGDRVELTLQNVAPLLHNLRFGEPINRAVPMMEPGRSDTITFTVPEDARGVSAYWCEPHRSLGMEGKIRIETAEEQRVPSPGLLASAVVAAAVALLLGRRAR